MENTKLSDLSISDLCAMKQYLLYLKSEAEDVLNHKEFCDVVDDFYYITREIQSEILKKNKKH